MMATRKPYRIRTITEYHRLLGLPKPLHTLISVIDIASFAPQQTEGPLSIIFDFYCISLKRDLNVSIKYGQQDCDFDEGLLFCMSPGQVWSITTDQKIQHQPSGWMILIHPDFLWNTTLAKTIKQYEYFNYSVHEALYLSEKEETMLNGIVNYIEQEYHSNIDQFSQNVIIAQLEVILTYTERFYRRQFITRNKTSHEVIHQVDEILNAFFKDSHVPNIGLPTVTMIAGKVNMSPGYLSELLKAISGQTAQQHIHEKLIEKAKERLSTTQLSISEIAYELGFEHAQSFNKLFKAKTSMTPKGFRASFN